MSQLPAGFYKRDKTIRFLTKTVTHHHEPVYLDVVQAKLFFIEHKPMPNMNVGKRHDWQWFEKADYIGDTDNAAEILGD